MQRSSPPKPTALPVNQGTTSSSHTPGGRDSLALPAHSDNQGTGLRCFIHAADGSGEQNLQYQSHPVSGLSPCLHKPATTAAPLRWSPATPSLPCWSRRHSPTDHPGGSQGSLYSQSVSSAPLTHGFPQGTQLRGPSRVSPPLSLSPFCPPSPKCLSHRAVPLAQNIHPNSFSLRMCFSA